MGNTTHAKYAGADQRVLCTGAFKAEILAQSLYCDGLPTLVTNLIRSYGFDNGTKYAESSAWEIYVTPASSSFVGKPFLGVLRAVYDLSGQQSEEGSILLLGVIEAGSKSRIINPREYTFQEGDSVISLAADTSHAMSFTS